jgi:hypothetical protein
LLLFGSVNVVAEVCISLFCLVPLIRIMIQAVAAAVMKDPLYPYHSFLRPRPVLALQPGALSLLLNGIVRTLGLRLRLRWLLFPERCLNWALKPHKFVLLS